MFPDFFDDVHGRPQKFFRGGNLDILVILFMLRTMYAFARSQNALPFLCRNVNAPRYGNSRKNRASLAHQCYFLFMLLFT